MDCDLQEAPEDIPRLWAAVGEGYDLVRTTRKHWRHSRFRRWASRVYRSLTLETHVRGDYSNLSLLSRRVIDAFLRLNDRDREYMIALDWLGFDSTTVEIEQHERHTGESSYKLQRLMRVALHGMFFRSTLLLRLIVLGGFVIALIGLGVAVFEIIDYFAEPEKTVPGYTSLAVLMLVLTGVIIFSVGIVGLYVGGSLNRSRIGPYSSSTGRPSIQHVHLLTTPWNQSYLQHARAVALHKKIKCRLCEPLGVTANARIGGAPAERPDHW
jgi:polyisoprenyl-phosphate glycosyltransferase